MKIRLFSDLHLEFGGFTPPPLKADLVVLAGDIHVGVEGIAWAKEHFSGTPVVYVPGNHEFYGHRRDHLLLLMKAFAQGSNVHVLDDSALIYQGVRFLGATLWTDYCLTGSQAVAMFDAHRTLHDFQVIRTDSRNLLTPQDVLELHKRSRAFLEGMIDCPFDGKTVVVSHHSPCEQSVHPRYDVPGNHLNSAYASSLDALMGEGKVALWVHGHVHESFAYERNGTRLASNPRGYTPKNLNPLFNPGLLLEV